MTELPLVLTCTVLPWFPNQKVTRFHEPGATRAAFRSRCPEGHRARALLMNELSYREIEKWLDRDVELSAITRVHTPFLVGPQDDGVLLVIVGRDLGLIGDGEYLMVTTPI